MKKTDRDIRVLLDKGEGLNIEIKECEIKLPEDVWETYSAFANTRGGEIVLGVKEHKKLPKAERFEITGVKDANKIVTDFFNMVNNPQKVNRSVVIDSNVQIVSIDGKEIVYIRVPEADYRHKPIYINQKLQNGTYKRVHEGDRHVSERELTMMLRDSFDNLDSQVIPRRSMNDIDAETLRGYRQMFENRNPNHPYQKLDNKEFLRKLGGYGFDEERQEEGLTMAGLLMFGKADVIHRTFTNFRVDYLDLQGIVPGGSKKWNDRLTDDGYWEDNIFNFLFLAMGKLLFTLPSEGKLNGTVRNDGGPLHEAVREAMVNSITYCDYKAGGTLRIDRRDDRIIMRNPGLLRLSPERIYAGDYTQARNGAIQKMLRMVGFGDNIGSGFTKIMNAWNELGFPAPTIRQEDEVDEVWLTLPLPSGFPIFIASHGTVNSADDPVNGAHDPVNDPVNSAHDPVIDPVNSTHDPVNSIADPVSDPVNSEQLSPLYRKILETIAQNPSIKTQQLCEELNISESTLKRAKRILKKEGFLIREGSDKTGRWIVNMNNNKN